MEWHMAIPGILRETSEGLQRIPVQDEMFRRREIECAGQITEESAYGISLQLRCLQAAGPGEGITLYINSPGGSVTAGLALYDVMKAVGCPVRTVCVGLAASMAALLFAAGDCRDMLPHARVMVHDPLIAGGVGGSALQVDSVSRNLMKTREVMAGLLARHTGKSISEIYEKTASDTYFDAQEAVDYGLADRIMSMGSTAGFPEWERLRQQETWGGCLQSRISLPPRLRWRLCSGRSAAAAAAFRRGAWRNIYGSCGRGYSSAGLQ